MIRDEGRHRLKTVVGESIADVDCDVLVVGGGINGAGIARDAAGRGLCVVLCEKDDLASHTSSASTKLIHGGLRYLEYYEFRLVRKALAEREVLLRSAPHIMWPMRFVMPHDAGQRPALLIRAGLFLYDMLAKRELLPGSRGINLRCHPAGRPLKETFRAGFEYSDGWVDDARLVVLNAMDACAKGACILTRTSCIGVERQAEHWVATLRKADGTEKRITTRAIVNAAGPWAQSFIQAAGARQQSRNLRLVKGSHIVVRRIFEHDQAYIFQNKDGRIVFAIPYERDFTLIGTTDLEYQGDPQRVAIEESEIRYLCELASDYFREPVRPADVVWTSAGVRPLVDEGGSASSVTRDYLLETEADGAPLLNVWGGKLTTYRKLAEDGATQLGALLGDARKPWTAGTHLPGGDLGRHGVDIAAFTAELQARHADRAPAVVARLARAYGSVAAELLAAPPGAEIAPGLFESELRHLTDHEWARSGEDVLWRRSKLGLHYTAAQRAAVQARFQ